MSANVRNIDTLSTQTRRYPPADGYAAIHPTSTPHQLGAATTHHYVIGKLARPAEIIFAPELPKTRSGKIMRRLLKNVAEDERGGAR